MRVGNLKKIALAASVVLAAGCSTNSTTDDTGSAMEANQQGSTTVETSSVGNSSMSSGGLTKADIMSLTNVFYFDFDQATIKPEAFADLGAHASYLVNNPSVKVVLAGHADERGTREYNLALGERRAKAVARYLTVQGVSSSQVEIISYGEEKPAVDGHDDASWGLNRRVEINY